MYVLGSGGGVVGRGAVAEMGMRNEPDLFEKLQIAIDRGDVDARGPLDHPSVHVFRGGMSQFDHGFQDELALRREAVAAGSQFGLEILPPPPGA